MCHFPNCLLVGGLYENDSNHAYNKEQSNTKEDVKRPDWISHRQLKTSYQI